MKDFLNEMMDHTKSDSVMIQMETGIESND